MKVYIFQAALLCEDCGLSARADLAAAHGSAEDSDEFPQGPYSDGGGEADTPQHCDHCGVFLENPLTSDGYDYIAELFEDYRATGRGSLDVLQEWSDFYGVLIEPEE